MPMLPHSPSIYCPGMALPAAKVADVDGYNLRKFSFEEALLTGVFKVRNKSEWLGSWCDGGRLSGVGRPWHSKTFCSPCFARAWHGPLPCEWRAGAHVAVIVGEDGGGVGSFCSRGNKHQE